MQIHQEKAYLMTADTNDNVYLIMSAKVGRPDEQAHVMYDGKEHALLYHHDTQIIILDFLPEKIRPLMLKAEKIKITETLSDLETVVRQYDVSVKHVESYPKNILESILRHEPPTDMPDFLKEKNNT